MSKPRSAVRTDTAFLRVLSHQLKSPIGTIQSLLQTVSDGFTGQLPAQAQQFVEKAIGKAREANSLIADLIEYEGFSKTAAMGRDRLDFAALVEGVADKYQAQASEKNVLLRCVVPEETVVTVRGNAKGLDIVLRNIVENAIKYTPAGGHVLMRLMVQAARKRCVLTVADSGIGIGRDELKRVFDPFYRSVKHRAAVSGTGLGLGITRNIVRAHRGAIGIASREGKGTTVRIALPLVSVGRRAGAAAGRKRVVIIGGVTAGPKCAARLRRLDETLDICIIEKSDFLSYSGCGLPSYISGKVISPKALMTTADNTIRDVSFFETIKNIRIMNNTLALAVDREARTVLVRDLATARTRRVPYDVLVLATGAVPLLPPIPGINLPGVYSLHRIEDAEAIKREFTSKNARDVIIVGGGLIGIETAESLIQAGARVTILEKRSHVLGTILDPDMAGKIQNELSRKGTKVITGITVTRLGRRGGQLAVHTDRQELRADFVILAAGVKPNSALARRAGLKIGRFGGVEVNTRLQTLDPRIYAIGDCAESWNAITRQHEYWPLGSISTKMGRIAADNICGNPSEFTGFAGTAMFRNFDLNIARTGLTTAGAQRAGFDPESAVVTGLDRAHYWKGAELVTLKVIADRRTQRVLGAAGYGKGDVVRQIEILAGALTRGMTLDDTFKLDLGYHPAYNHPIDLVQTACLFLKSKIEGFVRTISVDHCCREKDRMHIIDVSPITEHMMNTIPGSINVPLENLRNEGLPFDKREKHVLYSKTSSRAYEAYRYLITRGYANLFVLEGGYVFWAQ